jgi:hypothetical protein
MMTKSWLEDIGAVVGTAIAVFSYFHLPLWAGAALLLAGLVTIALRTLSRGSQPRLRGLKYALVMAAAAGALAIPVLVLWPSPPSPAFTCSDPARYDFADGTTQGWDVRDEGGVRLGIRTLATDSPHFGSQPGSLAFDFHLGAPPIDKAQIKIDNVSLTKRLSTCVYVPRGTPRTLELFGFVLEHNTGAEPGKPEWPFYKTRTVTLHAGQWTAATFAVSDFVGVNTNQTWSNPPLLLGFEIHSQEAGELDATVYFNHIAVN